MQLNKKSIQIKRKRKSKKKKKDSHMNQQPPHPDYMAPQKETRPSEVTVTINGEKHVVSSKLTIYEACTMAGAHVPTLCNHPGLPPTGRCGVCTVHVERHNPPLVQSCKTHVREGMVIQTNTPEVQYHQKVSLKEFVRKRKKVCAEPLTQEIEDLVNFMNAPTICSDSSDNTEYSIVRNQDLCIMCTRCVRACSDLQGLNILDIDSTHPLQPISFEKGLPLAETSCIACGQCAVICPTGAVAERDDTAIVEKMLAATGEDRRIMILQTAPSARLSLGEMLGDEVGECTDPAKAVAAAHAMGFDYVFDTCFTADATAYFEAIELVERMENDGPWPMFTSCCPGWVKLVEDVKK